MTKKAKVQFFESSLYVMHLKVGRSLWILSAKLRRRKVRPSLVWKQRLWLKIPYSTFGQETQKKMVKRHEKNKSLSEFILGKKCLLKRLDQANNLLSLEVFHEILCFLVKFLNWKLKPTLSKSYESFPSNVANYIKRKIAKLKFLTLSLSNRVQ